MTMTKTKRPVRPYVAFSVSFILGFGVVAVVGSDVGLIVDDWVVGAGWGRDVEGVTVEDAGGVVGRVTAVVVLVVLVDISDFDVTSLAYVTVTDM